MMDELFDGSLFSAIASGGLERPGATSAYATILEAQFEQIRTSVQEGR